MSQKTLNLCLERYNFIKFGETTKSSHTVLCTNNAYSVNSDKYRLTPTAIASKHGEGYVFTLNYDFDRPLFTIVQKSYSLDGTSGNIVFEGIDPISKGGSKYLRKVTVSPVKLSDGSYLLEVTKDEYLRIGTTGAAIGDEDLESLNEKIVTDGGITKSVETVGGKQVLKLDAGGPSGAKEIVYFEIDPSDPPSGIYDDITVALSNDKEPVIKIDGSVYFYTATGTDKYVFVGGYTKEAVGYTEIEVSDDDSVTSKSVDDKVFNMFLLYKTDPASPGDPPGDEDSWVCDANKHVITKDELVAAHADCRYFVLNNDVNPNSNSRKYFAAVTNVSNSYVQLRFYMVEYSGEGAANFYQKTVSNDSEGRLYISDSYQTYLAGTSQAVLVSEPQSFNATQKAQGRDNIGAASASDVKDMEEIFLINLPCAANTLRFEFSKMDYDPAVAGVGSGGTWKKVNAKFNNVWDWTMSGTTFASSFENAFTDSDNIVSVIAAGDTSTITSTYRMFYGCTSLNSVSLFDTSSVTSMEVMFRGCTSLTSIPLFNTSSVTNMFYTFAGCTSLTLIPLFNTSSVTNMNNMFNGCVNVKGGALALYQQASTQATPPSSHSSTFANCGIADIDGYCELCKVPVAWGGTQALVIEKSQGGTYEATLPGAYTVAEDSVYMPYELEVQHVVYDRSFAASTRLTMWLPFDLNIGAFTDNFDFQTISAGVRDGEIKVIYSAPPASGIIPKNTPISIRRKAQSSTERLEFGTGTYTISTQPKNVPEPVVFEGYEYQPVLIDKYTVFEAATDDLKYYGFRSEDGQLVSITAGAFIHPYKVVIKCHKV